MTKYYLQPEDYETAEKYGIDKYTLEMRFYQRDWDLKRALTQPKLEKKISPYVEYKEICDKNGISRPTFNARLRRGYSPMQAASKTVNKGIKLGRLS